MRLVGAHGLTAPFRMLAPDWQRPFNISLGLHIMVLALAMLAPHLFDRQPKLPEIYTVNLYTAVEMSEPARSAASAPATQTAAEPAASKPEPATKKPEISIQPIKPEVKTVAAKPISLKPRKLKIKVGKTVEEEAQDKARLSQVVKQLTTGAAKKEAEKNAAAAAKDAVSKLADVLKSTPAAATGGTVSAAGRTHAATSKAGISGPRGTGVEPDFYMKQYLSTVYQKIHDQWVLPDLQNWDNSLEAVLVITIRKDGVVTNSYFEKKSANTYFNQLVLKAVKDAAPLPPFPDQLNKNTFEIGLRFKPGELF